MLKVKCTVILVVQKTNWRRRRRRRKRRRSGRRRRRRRRRRRSTQDVAFSISPAALQYGISNVFITCDKCLSA